jgi:hypothetical protein
MLLNVTPGTGETPSSCSTAHITATLAERFVEFEFGLGGSGLGGRAGAVGQPVRRVLPRAAHHAHRGCGRGRPGIDRLSLTQMLSRIVLALDGNDGPLFAADDTHASVADFTAMAKVDARR